MFPLRQKKRTLNESSPVVKSIYDFKKTFPFTLAEINQPYFLLLFFFMAFFPIKCFSCEKIIALLFKFDFL